MRIRFVSCFAFEFYFYEWVVLLMALILLVALIVDNVETSHKVHGRLRLMFTILLQECTQSFTASCDDGSVILYSVLYYMCWQMM